MSPILSLEKNRLDETGELEQALLVRSHMTRPRHLTFFCRHVQRTTTSNPKGCLLRQSHSTRSRPGSNIHFTDVDNDIRLDMIVSSDQSAREIGR
ncbi:hypothetical protein SeLEV6574_g08646 [Synchytrium endobioticum]|uniref:Uncharacterized protein n=1 Tax=Synchytrium endobioticum TaxID=286115 RepID=A0A507BXK9_9FUNG|nr:hypothetical protein SeLEV6574_g08646 [Synchytrium endobioticum]